MDDKKLLVGKVIKDIYISADRVYLKFNIDDGSVILGITEADCCSSTWVESLDDPEAIIGSPVIGCTDIEMPGQPDPDEYTYIQYYGMKITTAKGSCVIDYRNESNGYYGGCMYFQEVDSDGQLLKSIDKHRGWRNA